MKAMMAAVSVLVVSWVCVHAQQPATGPAKVETKGESTVVAPIVRLPVPAEAGEAMPGKAVPAPTPVPELEPVRPTAAAFQTGGVGLRAPQLSFLKTNGPVEFKGPVPKLMRPERRTFGGFLTSFANLFNPLAPLSPAEAAAEDHRYDGRVNRSPLPRGFRDERYHEPQALIIGVGFDGAAQPVPEKQETPPRTPVP